MLTLKDKLWVVRLLQHIGYELEQCFNLSSDEFNSAVDVAFYQMEKITPVTLERRLRAQEIGRKKGNVHRLQHMEATRRD